MHSQLQRFYVLGHVRPPSLDDTTLHAGHVVISLDSFPKWSTRGRHATRYCGGAFLKRRCIGQRWSFGIFHSG